MFYGRQRLYTGCSRDHVVFWAMVLILDGNSEHVAHTWRNIDLFWKRNPICDCSRSNQMAIADQIARLLFTCAPISDLPSNIYKHHVLICPNLSFLEIQFIFNKVFLRLYETSFSAVVLTVRNPKWETIVLDNPGCMGYPITGAVCPL